jgi:hypothetical protein
LFVPISVLKSASFVDFQGGRNLLLVTDVDTVFFDLLIGIGLISVVSSWKRVLRDPATVCFLLCFVGATTLLMAYVVTNYGTLFRLRLIIAAPIWILPMSVSMAGARTPSRAPSAP